VLIEFSVQNFRSFREEQRLSMVASDKHALPESLIEVPALGKQRLLRTAVIYGPNASGKSNLFNAFAFVRSLIVGSLDRNSAQGTGAQNFRLSADTLQEPSIFELHFVQEGIRYEYRLVLDATMIREEALYAFPKGRAQRWYHRHHNGDEEKPQLEVGPILKGRLSTLRTLLQPHLPILALAQIINSPQLLTVYRWFSDTIFTLFQDPGAGNSQTELRRVMTQLVAGEVQLHQPLTTLLQRADTGIRELAIREDVLISVAQGEHPSLSPLLELDSSQRRQKYVQFRHGGANGDSHNSLFSIEEESQGTQQLFVLGVFLLNGLKNGQVFAIDELDTSLHPQLVRALVQLFHAENPHNAQLIFNTHDASLLRGDLFDRDQIWFMEKDHEGASHLYSLLEFRKDAEEAEGENREQEYLLGRYGAVPLIDHITWEELRLDATP